MHAAGGVTGPKFIETKYIFNSSKINFVVLKFNLFLQIFDKLRELTIC